MDENKGCPCNRPWEGIPLWEIRLRVEHRREDLAYFQSEVAAADREGDPGLAEELDQEYLETQKELDELTHELWHRGEPEPA